MPRDAHDTSSSGYEWRAGTATRVITPEKPMWMAGFAKREDPATGVEHDLEATALALEDESGTLAAIVSADVLFIPRAIRDAVTQRCEANFGIDPDSIVLAATHTHCGPEFRDFKVRMYADDVERYRTNADEYRERLEDELVTVIGEALDGRAPVRLSYSHARCGFAMNRRLPVEDGIAHEQNPDGPVDHEVPVLVVEPDEGGNRTDGMAPSAIVFGYACHTTTLSFTEYCGDWAGFARQYLEERYSGVTALCLLGCAGDQNPYPRGDVDLAKHHGCTMATTVRAAIESRRRPIRGPLRTGFEDCALKFENPPSRDELEAMRKGDVRHLRVRAEALLDELDETGTIRTEHPYPIQAFGFGDDLTLVALGGEVLVEYGIQLKDRLEGPVWVAGYANDEFTYVPTARVRAEGGYESEGAIRRSAFSGPLDSNAEERILQHAQALGERVRSSRTIQ
ncbi:neutral/alkaline non-lysosomal ceramidase N-terminal domain-containing protein [Natronosalvus halobius]|uniref:neutral/alkaline non-lysosomal ceramidase N-terminal domain-containing protein n=1 Tax=Natronosalvus halobius TaxID=2953746 RepID=UPI00209CD433|nr:neutral/alkaline non-lysosomal ceramidase N-terminal domain-containing protein [Natronosalvus halobius]USZ72443.1 neutral/alkaline non-lysosomal ceramidase N-terminal domain-containing protein [Natronosalvus halobius]